MLILNRRIGEKIIINDNIEVTICHIKDGYVKLGIKAPEDITINREEVHQRKKLEQAKPKPLIKVKPRYYQPAVNQKQFYCQP